MFENTLTPGQLILAKKLFSNISGFFLAGGTAISLQIGHRRSIDFDLASFEPIDPFKLERSLMKKKFEIQKVFTATSDEYSILMESVRLTFFNFPFQIDHPIEWKKCRMTMPDIVGLGAMKAYALGRRNRWKDYVDLYYLLRDHVTIESMIEKANTTFSRNFNEKLFREQLCFFEDMDESETIDYIADKPDNNEIKSFLESVAVDF
ncbi:MAG: hypothetical protein C4530_18290 [Desulfobacteraceae bacterium]|nr:MAG: hypothetical protein C4530_18290 [Desulfobacteraceae bacterium]